MLGNFGECPSQLVTTPKTGAGDPIPEGGLSIGPGSVSVKDSAVLSVTGTDNFTGTLSFHICGPTLNTCDTGGVAAGSSTVTANGTYTSDPVTVTSAGRYCWRGDFVSGTPGVPNSSDSSEGECFFVAPKQPTISTQASANVALNSPVHDTATLAGTANQPGTPNVINPTTAGGPGGGSITFKLYGPSATAVCTDANLVYTSPTPIAVSGDGNYVSGNFTPTVVGTYRWIASYTGDPPNTLGVSGACTDANESVVVSNSSLTTTPKTGAGADIPNRSRSVPAPSR